MAKFSLVFKKSVAEYLRSIPNRDVKRLLALAQSLCDDPGATGCIKLSSQERYRVRLGVYRIIYEIQEKELIIQVIKIGHRREVYR